MGRTLLVGLEPFEADELRGRIDGVVSAWTNLPPIVVDGGELLVPRSSGPGLLSVDRVVFHGVFADDLDFFAGLALWGGACLPDASAMLRSRLKLPCLIDALAVTRFGGASRSFVFTNASLHSNSERVAKWGNWHCGENKARFCGRFVADEPSVIEPFWPGRSVRIARIGDESWQIGLDGDDWKKSIHDNRAAIEPDIDPELLADTIALQEAFGLPWIAVDYIALDDGNRYFLELNAMPNVSRFPALWDAFSRTVVAWCGA